MKVIIYNAISIDGYIADANQQTDWVSETDWKQFNRLVKQKKAIVMGSTTYEASEDAFPYACELNIVMTSQEKFLNMNKNPDTIFTNKTPQEVVQMVKKQGFKELLVIGGGKLNASFMKAGLVTEVIVDIHPIILGSGVKLFETNNLNIKMEKLETNEMDEGLTTIRYKVIN